jgi:hypothetical protein
MLVSCSTLRHQDSLFSNDWINPGWVRLTRWMWITSQDLLMRLAAEMQPGCPAENVFWAALLASSFHLPRKIRKENPCNLNFSVCLVFMCFLQDRRFSISLLNLGFCAGKHSISMPHQRLQNLLDQQNWRCTIHGATYSRWISSGKIRTNITTFTSLKHANPKRRIYIFITNSGWWVLMIHPCMNTLVSPSICWQ